MKIYEAEERLVARRLKDNQLTLSGVGFFAAASPGRAGAGSKFGQ